MAKPIRVLVANRPKLMRDLIVSIVADEPDMELVGEVSEQEEAKIGDRIRETMPDLVVVTLEDPKQRPEFCDTFLREWPGSSVIAVAPQANRCVCYWAVSNVESREIELSERGFLAAVRDMAERVGSRHWYTPS